jgi:hypothetical protein
VFILGEALTITGDKVSFRPPVGLDLLAHCVMEKTNVKSKKYFPILYISIHCAHKITQYSQDNLLARETILIRPTLDYKIVFPQLEKFYLVIITTYTSSHTHLFSRMNAKTKKGT